MSETMLHETIGARLKRLLQENDFTQENFGKEWNFVRGTISRYCNDVYPIPKGYIPMFAKKLGVREEYLLCQDDFRTEEELLQYFNESDIGDMKAAINYLKSLGLTLIPRNFLNAPVVSVYERYPEIEHCIKEEDKQSLLDEFDFSLPSDDFKRKYSDKRCYLQLIAPLPEDMLLNDESFSKSSLGSRYIELRKDGQTDSIVSVYFDAYFDDKYIQRIGVRKVQNLIETMDLYVRFSIDNFLLNGDEGEIF